MKRSLRKKILAIFLVLDIMMIAGVALIGYNFRIAVSSANRLADDYLAIQKDFGVVDANMQNLVKRFFICQSMNYMGAMSDKDTAKAIIDPGVSEREKMVTAMADLEEKSVVISDATYQEQLEALKTAVNGFAELYADLRIRLQTKSVFLLLV